MAITVFEIDHDIPIPKPRPRPRKYPFRDMQIGDSFYVPQTIVKNIAPAAAQVAKRMGNGAKFTCRSIDGGVRVWRVK